MTLHIHNAEADRLAHELSHRTGKTVDDVVLEALRERANHFSFAADSSLAPDEWERQIAKIGHECATLPELDARTPDEILYDKNGLPY